jgi:hypothetical protein
VCFRVFQRAHSLPDGQELKLCDAPVEGPVSPPASEDQSERSRDDSSATPTRRTVVGDVAALRLEALN